MTPIPRDTETQRLWTPELARAKRAARECMERANMYLETADNLKPFAPELAGEYLDYALATKERAAEFETEAQRIQDYLAGRIGPWW